MKQTTGRFPLEILYDRKLDANDRLIALCCYSFANWKTGEANFSLKIFFRKKSGAWSEKRRLNEH